MYTNGAIEQLPIFDFRLVVSIGVDTLVTSGLEGFGS